MKEQIKDTVIAIFFGALIVCGYVIWHQHEQLKECHIFFNHSEIK